MNWAPEAPLEIAAKEYIPVYGPGYRRWRLEVEPAVPATTDFFLNVLKPTLDAAEKLPPMRKLETADSFGAEIPFRRQPVPGDAQQAIAGPPARGGRGGEVGKRVH